MAPTVSAVTLLAYVVLVATVVSVDHNGGRPKNEVTEIAEGLNEPAAIDRGSKLGSADVVNAVLPIVVNGKVKRHFLNHGWISMDKNRTVRPVHRNRSLSGIAQAHRTSSNRFSTFLPVYRFRPLSGIAQIHRTNLYRFVNHKNFNFYNNFKNKSKNRKRPKAKQSKKPKLEDDNTEYNNENPGKSTAVNNVGSNTSANFVTTATETGLTTPVTTAEKTKEFVVNSTPEVDEEATSNSPNEEASSIIYKVLAEDAQTATSDSPNSGELSTSILDIPSKKVPTASPQPHSTDSVNYDNHLQL